MGNNFKKILGFVLVGFGCLASIPNGFAFNIRHFTGFQNPSSVVTDGTYAYVADYGASKVVRMDISKAGQERTLDSVATPVTPVDIYLFGEKLYITDDSRLAVYVLALSDFAKANAWREIRLNSGKPEYNYGRILFGYQDQVFVPHPWDGTIDQLNLTTEAVTQPITGIPFLPRELEFSGNKMVVLSQGMAAPDCAAMGPTFHVYELPAAKYLYTQNLSGECINTFAVKGDKVFIAGDSGIRAFDLNSGQFQTKLSYPKIGRHLVAGKALYAVRNEEVMAFNLSLGKVCNHVSILTKDQTWVPPLEGMVVLPGTTVTNERVLVTNRNDGSVTIVEGLGCN